MGSISFKGSKSYGSFGKRSLHLHTYGIFQKTKKNPWETFLSSPLNVKFALNFIGFSQIADRRVVGSILH